jgi:hypothetical protein
MTELPCLQEVTPTEPVDQGDEGEWNTVGNPLGVVAQPPLSKSSWRRWSASPPAPQGSMEPAAAAAEEVVAAGAQESAAPAAVATEEAAAAGAQEEAPAEAGLVDIASILGAPTVTIVR